jgi:outer membrane protein
MRSLLAICFLPLLAAGVHAQTSAPAAPASAPAASAGQTVRPDVPVATANVAQPGAASQPTETAATHTGTVLDLEQALRIAREHAPELRQAAAASEAARARVDEATAPLLPQVTGTASYTRGTFNTASGTYNGVAAREQSFETRSAFSFGARVTQLIYDFGQNWNIKDAAKYTARAQEQTEQANLLDITFNVRSAFLTAAADKALWEVAVATQQNQVRHLDQIRGFVEVGTRAPIDLAQARTDVASAKLTSLRALNAYFGAKASLSRTMGVSMGADFEVSTELPPPEEGETAGVEELVQRAEKERPDFLALRTQVMAEETTLRSIKGQYGPSLSAVGAADATGFALDHMAGNLSAGLSLTWPIFQGGVTNGRVDEAHALVRGISAQLDGLREDLRLALTQAVLSVEAAQAELATADDLVGLAQERLVLAEGRYETGVGNTIELGDAQLALRDAQTQHVTAAYDLAIARAQLRHSLGRL